MKIIILGAGQVGSSSADILASEANDVTLVDIDPSLLRTLQDRLDIRTVEGNASYPSILKQAGAEDADLLLAVTNSDEVNMVACEVASAMYDTPKKMARIRSSEYLACPQIFASDAITIDVLISPEQILTNHIMRLVEYPGALQVLDFADGRIQIVGMRAYHGGPLVGHPLAELRDHMPGVEARVAAIYRQNEVITPTADTVVEPEDEVFFVAARENIRAVMSEMQKIDKSVNKVMLAGGGNIGFRLASNLESMGYGVKVIEHNSRRAEIVADRLHNTVVLLGDAADEELLRQENIENMDVFCAVTNNDEANILSALLAKRLGANRVMALINRSVYVDLFEYSELDIVISPRLATVGSILAHIRRGDVVAVHSLRRGRAEAIEAIAHGDKTSSRVVGRGVRDLPLPPGTQIGAILRNDDVLIAHKETTIESEDHVILFMVDKKYIPEVERLFQVDVMFL
ncbi:MAG: Trk system potassium transporter TrkA [Arenicellales bacterium]|nr:Trk system potassium transporter TrkA [Arenicellales bacterium]